MNRPWALENSEDMLLWNMLTLSGIRLFSANDAIQKLSTVVTVFLFLSAIYAVSLNIAALVVVFDKFFLLYLAYYFLSIFLWCSLYRKLKEITELLRKVYKLRILFSISKKKSSLIINGAPLVIDLILTVVFITESYLMIRAETRSHYFTFSCEVEGRLLNDISLVFGLFFSYTLVFYIPCMASLTFSVFEYRLSEILASYNSRLKLLLENNNTDSVAFLVKLFFMLSDICKEMKDILSLPLFLLIATNFTGLSVALSKVISPSASVVSIIESVLLSSVTCLAILSQGILGSLIPEKLEAISKTAGKIVEKYGRKSKKENSFLFYFKRMAKSEITYLTASDVFRFDRGFILHAFGAILTYGLLIINLK